MSDLTTVDEGKAEVLNAFSDTNQSLLGSVPGTRESTFRVPHPVLDLPVQERPDKLG